MKLSIVILAAGQGKRMQSQLPKVLHCLAGQPLLERVIKTALALHPAQPPIVITGHQGNLIREKFSSFSLNWVEQKEQLGTGHAVLQTLPLIPDDHHVLILYGDVPLIRPETLNTLIKETPPNSLGMITALFDNPTGFGRIIRDNQKNVVAIVEEKDANSQQKEIKEINSGIYLAPAALLKKCLPLLKNNNNQKEYYLTDIVAYAAEENKKITAIQPTYPEEISGINDRVQLAELEHFHRIHSAEKYMLQGVSFADPNRFDLRGELSTGKDIYIDINVILEGKIVIGNHCKIGPNSYLRDVILGDHVEVKANSIIEESEISDYCIIGPFTRIRPETKISSHAHIGNFVEIKKSWIGSYTKINHLSYIGDSEIGRHVNVGAGTITCNYDGANKHKTTIGDHAFIGSNSQLVAPVSIGANATIGAGSTITKDAPPDQLTLCRASQKTITNWQRPQKKGKE